MLSIHKIVLILLLVAIATNCYPQWKMTQAGVFGTIQSSSAGGKITFKDGFLWAGISDIWVSADSGLTWLKRSLNDPVLNLYVDDIAFFDRNNGIVAKNGGSDYITHDGGKNWTHLSNSSIATSTACFFWDTPNEIAFLGSNNNPVFTVLFQSNDGGISWINTTIDNSNNSSPTCAKYLGNGLGYIFVNGYMLLTLDRGITWNQQKNPTEVRSWSFDIDPCDYNKIFLANQLSFPLSGGVYSHIFVSSDSGNTWSTKYSDSLHDLSGGFVSTDNAIYCQSVKGGVLRSTNNGVIWKNIGGPYCGNSYSRMLTAINDSLLIAIDSLGNVWRTDNSGGFPITIQQKIAVSFDTLKLGFDTACVTFTKDVPISSLCKDINIISASLSDTSILSFSADTLPFITSDKSPGTLHLHFTAKTPLNKPYKTILKIIYKTYDLSTYEMDVPVIIDGATLDLSNLLPESFTIKDFCIAKDTIFTITNPFCGTITINSFSFSDSSKILFGLPNTPITLTSGATIRPQITMKTDSAGVYTNDIIMKFTFGGVSFSDTIPISITATKGNALLKLSPNPLAFGTINICKPKTKIVTFTNSKCYDVQVSAIDWKLANPGFTLLNPPATPLTLKAGESETLSITYAPLALGNVAAKLHIQIESDGKSIDTTLLITGTASSSAVCELSDSLLAFDSVSTCASRTLTAYLINDNCDSILVTQYQALSQAGFIKISPPLPFELGAGDSLLITITYSPKQAGQILDSIEFLGATKTGTKQVQTLVLSGFGESDGGKLSYEPKQFAFQSLSICQHDSASGFVANVGCDSLRLDPAQIFGSADFKLTANSLQLRVLAPRDTENYTVYLNPAAKGLRQGMLVLTSHGASSEIDSIPFTCTVHDGTKILSSSVNAVDFGTVSVCDEKDTTITLTNSGCDTVWVLGSGFQGLGFGTNGKFPIMILPGHDTTIDIYTVLDTAGGKISSSAIISFTSDCDSLISPIRPISLMRTYSSSTRKNISFILDGAAKPGGDQNTVLYNFKEASSFTGSNINSLKFTLNYNTDLLDFDAANSKNISFDGKNFIISPVSADGNGVLAQVAFRVYLTKDSTTPITMNYLSDTMRSPCGILSVEGSGSAFFDFAFSCGEHTIQNYLNGILPLRIISIRPNPAQDEIIIDIAIAGKGDQPVAPTVSIFDALGNEVYSKTSSMSYGTHTTRIDTKNLPGGVYLVRIGSASGNFIKIN